MLCIYNDKQVGSVQKAVQVAKVKRELMNGLKDYEALPQGTQFTFKV